MKIRTRIAFWVSLAGLASSAVLSLLVFFWGLETPYEFLDQELEIRAHAVLDELTRQVGDRGGIADGDLERFSHLYWVRIYDSRQQLVFASAMAREIDMPLRQVGGGYLVATDISLNHFYPEEDDENAAFWNRVFRFSVVGAEYRVHVARPVESLVGESIEMAVLIGSALLVSALTLFAVSFLVAGRILRPIRKINRMAADITENTLEQRLPLAGNGDEIDELAATLNEMFDRLQHSFRRQKEFIANASHELKTPITLLRLSMEGILQDEQLPQPLQEKLLAQELALSRISQLVKSLLDLSRLELTGQLDRQTFSLAHLLLLVAEDFQPLMAERRLTFTCEAPVEAILRADREKIRRVLINLLDNAIRYNLPGGEIACRLEQRAGQVFLTMTNTGPGIGREDQARVFEQFFRCERSRSIEHGGAGLGLTIVKRIVELHGGRITVHSEPGGPTAVEMVLPDHTAPLPT